MTHIGKFAAFAKLTPHEHQVITSGWVNGVVTEHIASELQLPIGLVEAYYGVRNLMAYEAELSE